MYLNSPHGSCHCLCKWPLFELASFADVPIGFSVHKMRAEDPDDQSTLNFFVVEPITAITPDGVLVDRSLYNITVCISGCGIVHVTSYEGILSVNSFYLSESINNFISPILFMDVIFKWGCCSLCILFVDAVGNPQPQIWLTSCIDFSGVFYMENKLFPQCSSRFLHFAPCPWNYLDKWYAPTKCIQAIIDVNFKTVVTYWCMYW